MNVFSTKLIEFPYSANTLRHRAILFAVKVCMGFILQYKLDSVLPTVSKKIKGWYATLGPDKWDLGWLADFRL